MKTQKMTLKKVLSVVLVLMMVLSTMVIMPLTTSAASTAVQPDGTGTSEDPYILTSAGNCVWLYNAVKADTAGTQWKEDALNDDGSVKQKYRLIYAELANDITLDSSFTFENEGYAANEWHFDGKGYTLSGCTTMPFKSAAGEIKNLTIVDSAIRVGSGSTGGLVGYASNLTFTNCTIADSVTVTATADAARIGAFAGYAGGTCVFNNCVNNATVTGGTGTDKGAGSGFVGTTYGNTVITFNNCTNNGDVSACKYAGAFMGHFEGGTLNLTNCVNTGAITADFAAGISAGPAGAVNATNCLNEGAIVGTTYAGGFAASFRNATLNYCVNDGDVTSDNYAGGFAAFEQDNANATFAATNCINHGAVSAPNAVASILAHSKTGSVTITDCYSVGANSGKALVGEATNAVAPTITNNSNAEAVLSLISVPKNAATGAAWDGSEVIKPALKDPAAANSATNPYIITTGAELAYFSQHNASAPTTTYWAQLGANINLGGHEWLGLTNPQSFTINLDGANYTISNALLKGYSKGFIPLPYFANISNLHFSNIGCLNGSASQAGIVIAAIENDNANVTLTNVTTDASCFITNNAGSGKAGGLVGRMVKGSLTITNCTSATTVATVGDYSGTSFTDKGVGGILGYAGAASTVSISNCVNQGGLGGQVTGRNCTGAIIGLNLSPACTLTNVYDYAALTNTFANYVGPKVTNSYIGKELTYAQNAAAIEEINKMGIDTEAITVSKATTVRLKLTDDFGFMAIANEPTGLSVYNPHVQYGMVIDGVFYAGGQYSNTEYNAIYTGLSAAKMNKTIEYQMAVRISSGHLVKCEEVQNINCYTFALDCQDGIWGNLVDGVNDPDVAGTALDVKPGECDLYIAMVAYHDAYVKYLESNGLIVEGANK